MKEKNQVEMIHAHAGVVKSTRCAA